MSFNLDLSGLESLVDSVETQILESEYEIDCPNCLKKIVVSAKNNDCPHCREKIEINFTSA